MTLLSKQVFILLSVFCSVGFGVQAGSPGKEGDYHQVYKMEAPISTLEGVILVSQNDAFLRLKAPFTEAMFEGDTPFGQALEEVINLRVLNAGADLDHQGQYIRQTYRDASDESTSVGFQLSMHVSSPQQELIVERSGNNLLRVIQSQKSVLQLHGNGVNKIHNSPFFHFAVGVPAGRDLYIAKCRNELPVVSPYYNKNDRVYVNSSRSTLVNQELEFNFDPKFELMKIEISGLECPLQEVEPGKKVCIPESNHCHSDVPCAIYAYLDLKSHPGLIADNRIPVNYQYKDALDQAYLISTPL